MIAALKSYPVYRDTGVPWLGELPAGWRLLPGRACFREKKVPNVGLAETSVLSLSYGQIVVKPEEKLHGLVPASFETYQVIDPGDIIVRPTDLQNDWNSLRFGLSGHRGIITSAYMCLSTSRVVMREFGYLLLHSYDLKKIFYGLGSGLRQNLDWRDFKYLPCVVPIDEEQAAIARFLDYMDRRIRRYIRAKQKLIKLLEEQKQDTTHRVVTRGLDPNVRLTPSGVPWLGEVPEHWEVARLKRVSRIQGGYAFPADSFGDVGIPVVRMNNIRRGTLDFEQVVRVPEHQRKEEFALAEGDIVYGLSGSIGTTGSLGNYALVRQADLPAQLNQRVARFRVNRKRITEGFLLELLATKEFYEQVLVHTTGTAQFNVSTTDVGNVAFGLPPLDEQERVVAHLKVVTASIVAAVNRAHREIGLLREYRTRLIVDVVTGKLDVRETAANLPDHVVECEPLEDTDLLVERDEEGADVELEAVLGEVEL